MTEIFTKSQAAKIEPSYYCESICAYKDKVFIGTKQGVVIVYSVNYEKQDDKSFEVKGIFNFIIRDFNRKPITQIELAEEFGICFFLSNGIIYVYRLKDYKLIHSTDLKYISKFCLDVYNQNDKALSTSQRSDSYSDKVQNDSIFASSIVNADVLKPSKDLRICLIVKKKLVIMNWDKEKYALKPTDKCFRLTDIAITVQFFHNFLCVATKSEYMLISINTGDVKPLFNVGKSQDPFILRISDLIGLKIENTIEFINKDGNFMNDNSLCWSFVPSVLLYHPPFVISLTEKFIEVRMITTGILIQSLLIENSSLICRYCDRLYVLSDKKLIFLSSKSRQHQVQVYADIKDFETALILAKTAPLVGEGEIDCGKINIQYALNLFQNRLFEKSFNIFFDIKSDPSNVLNLFPSLCPKKVTNDKVLEDNSEITKDFTEQENTEAIRALIEFLVKWRNKLRKSQENILCISIVSGKNIDKSKNTLQKIIDTSLLKCYLIINSPLVAPLLRQENFCHVDEAKKTLEKYEKFQELVLLYENHGMHDEALQLLHSQSVKTHTSLCGHQPTITYMKNLNPQYLPLIYQYGDWILKKFPMDWLNIFTYWYQKEKTISKDESVRYFAYKDDVLKHLQEHSPKMVIPFLERIIYENNNNDEYDLDTIDNDNKESESFKNSLTYKLIPLDDENGLPIIINPPFAVIEYLHTCYVNSLIDEILPLNPGLLRGLPINNELKDTSSDFKYLHQLRSRLKLFLQSSKSKYNADRVLAKLPYDGFYEERTILLARAGKHEQALTLWIYVLKDWQQAEEHCKNVYETNKEIFFKLLNICIEPSDPTSIGIVLPEFQLSPITNNKFMPQLDKALEIMKKYGDKLNSSLAIKLLSSAFNIKDLLPFARNSLIRQSSQLNQSVFLRNIQFYNRLLTNLKRCLAAQRSFVVDKGSRCTVCLKLMGSSAFVRNPDGSLVHYGCCKNLPKLK